MLARRQHPIVYFAEGAIAPTFRQPILALVSGLLACGLLAYNAASSVDRAAPTKLVGRVWRDMSAATKLYLDREFPLASAGTMPTETTGYFKTYRQLVTREKESAGIRPWEFWRTIPATPFLAIRDQLFSMPALEDPGRAIGLAYGFRMLGGISPYLIRWLAALACFPILLWMSFEFFDAGYPWAGTAFLFLLASSPFVVECLLLPHSAIGFYLLALLILVTVSVHAVLGRPTGAAGLLLRTLLAGSTFAVCVLCRSGSLMLLPGFVLAFLLALRRARLPIRIIGLMRSGVALAGMAALFLVPYVVLRQPQHHSVWADLWEGLGDYDRTKGHTWADAEAQRTLREAGLEAEQNPPLAWLNEKSEAFFRTSVWTDVRSDPWWFATILVERAAATITQRKLWPWGPRDGQSFARSVAPNEGLVDSFYEAATPVDFFAAGGRRVEIPVSLLLAPTAGLILLFAATAWSRRAGDASQRAGQALLVLLCVAVAGLALPVLITTSSGFETEAFALVYLLGGGFLLEIAVRSALRSTYRRMKLAPLLCVAGQVLLSGCRSSAPLSPPHIVLVSADALRADHLSLSGYARNTSPHLDDFVHSAWHFTEAVSVLPKTGPAITTMFSGLYPNEHKVEANRYAIPSDVPLLAEMLHARGYRTAAFVSNPILSGKKGYQRGFEVFEMVDGVAAANRAFTAWASQAWSEPTFVWIHYIDPHGPYTPPERFAKLFRDDALARGDPRHVALEYQPIPGFPRDYTLGAVPEYQRLGNEDRVAAYVSRYDGEIRLVDEAFHEIVELLRRDDRYDRSVVVFTSDHGESLGEHQYYFEHGWFVYDDALRVPLLIHTPKQSRAVTVSRQVSNLDLLPTLLALAGLTPPAGLAGQDLLGALDSDRALMVANSSTYPERTVGLRVLRWKFISTERGPGTGKEQLYDLAADPLETADLAPAQPERARAMRERLRVIHEATRAPATRNAPEVAPDDPQGLKSLGYVN